jgi:hypothetical protein
MSKDKSRILSRLSSNDVVEIVGLTIIFFAFLIITSLADDLIIFGYGLFDFRIIHVMIALIPLLILLAVIGDLEEIRGPMGVSLSIRNEANRSINPAPRNTSIDFISGPTLQKGALEFIQHPKNADLGGFQSHSATGDTIDERDLADLDESATEILDVDIDQDQLDEEQRTRLKNHALVYKAIEESEAILLSFEIGHPQYDISAISEYMWIILRHPRVHHVLFVDRSHKFAGLMEANDFDDYCEAPWTNVVDDIETGTILEDERMITESVHIEATNKQAIKK